MPPAVDVTPSTQLSLHEGASSELTLHLASLKSTQTTYVIHTNPPYVATYCIFQNYLIRAGATPKLITSPNESNSFPILDVPLINLAIRPSSASIKPANNLPITAIVNFPSVATLIEVNPIHVSYTHQTLPTTPYV